MTRSKKPMIKTKRKSSPVKKSAIKKAKPMARKKIAIKRKIKKVLAIPKGYHSITPYLIVHQAANAIEFYKKAFGAKEKERIEQPTGKIGHAELQVGDSKIMLADAGVKPNMRSPRDFGGSSVGIHFYVKNVDEIISRAVKAGAKLLRNVETMFYGDRSGEVEDPFGYKWHISTHVEDVSLAQVKKRMAKLAGNK